MKINSLSPYFVYNTEANLDSVVLSVWIYTGTQTTSRPASPTYILQSTAINNETQFEISAFVKDFFDINLESGKTSQSVWVDYQTVRTVSAVAQSADTIVALTGFYSYGYFEEGSNPQNSSGVMQTNSKILTFNNKDVSIPIDQSLVNDYQVYNAEGDLVFAETITEVLTDANTIRYINTLGLSLDSFEARVLADSGTFETSDCLKDFIGCVTVTKPSKVIISGAGFSQTIPITNRQEYYFPQYKLTFVNKYGAFQDILFQKRTIVATGSSTKDFSKNIIEAGGYNTTRHHSRVLDRTSKIEWMLNSGHYPDEYNAVFRELNDSDFVWLTYKDVVYPVKVLSGLYMYKESRLDKQTSNSITIEGAFNAINNVR